MVQDDPFAVLGLPALAELTDDDVRAAWRRIAAATHPDREDGGDPARFGAAAAAYALLRTSFGRGEALADLSAGAHPRRSRRPRGARRTRRSWSTWRSWREGRPWHLARLSDRWHPQRRGAHRLHAAAPPPVPAPFRRREVPEFRGRRVPAGRLRQVPSRRPRQVPRGRLRRVPAGRVRKRRPGARAAGRRRHARRGGGDRRGRLDARDHRAGRRGADGYRVGPVATGLAGSVIQSDQDPTYRPAGMPARVRASTSCAAVTPEPQ